MLTPANPRPRPSLPRWMILLLGLTALLAPPAALAAPPAKMSFRNDLVPGHLTVHRLARTVTRTAQRKAYTEQLRYKQEADCVQCGIEETKPGKVMVYQMIVEHPAKVVSFRHDKKDVTPTPAASDFSLATGTPALRSIYRTPQDSPAQVPMTDPAQRAVLEALLDFAHWPAKQIDAGHTWERDLRGNGIAGTQRFRFVDVAESEGKAFARVALVVEGQFEDPLAKDYKLGKCQAVITWSRLDRQPVKVEGEAEYERRRENAPEEYKLKLDVELVKFQQLSEKVQESIIDQMLLFAQAQKAQREGKDREAIENCQQFRKQWPDSIWMPVVDELMNRLKPGKKEETGRMSAKELDGLLVKTVIAHEAARTNYEYDLLARTGETLSRLADEQRSELLKLTKGKEDGPRGRAVFALAFSRRMEDLRTVEKAVRDDSPAVRAMALAGLAARRHPETSVELLVVMLDDGEAQVRRRACEAVAACMPATHYAVVKAVEKLDNLIIQDENPGVRLEAVRALAAIGAQADIPRLEKALNSELNPEIRAEINKAIARLQEKNA